MMAVFLEKIEGLPREVDRRSDSSGRDGWRGRVALARALQGMIDDRSVGGFGDCGIRGNHSLITQQKLATLYPHSRYLQRRGNSETPNVPVTTAISIPQVKAKSHGLSSPNSGQSWSNILVSKLQQGGRGHHSPIARFKLPTWRRAAIGVSPEDKISLFLR
jgi:hypothetical protein